MFFYFFLCLVVGLASHWFMFWAGLELMLMLFIFWNLLSGVFYKSAMKYFYVQVFCSLLFVFFVLFVNEAFIFILFFKMGLPPFHFWFFGLLWGLSFKTLFLMSVFQKLPVIVFLSCVFVWPLLFLSMGSMFLSGALAFYYFYLVDFLILSSFNHSGWILFLSFMSGVLFLKYLAVYFLLSFFLFLKASKSGIFYFLLFVVFGVPPSPFFFLKWETLFFFGGFLTSFLFAILAMNYFLYLKLFYWGAKSSISQYFFGAALFFVLFIIFL